MTRNLRNLSLKGAIRYFDVMLKPIITYGLTVIWEDMKPCHFETIEKCKCAFLKRVMGLHKSTRNRLVIMLSGLPLLSEELVSAGLPRTEAYLSYLDSVQEKLADIDPEFFNSPGMNQDSWKAARCTSRHRTLRVSCHGFHHKLCRMTNCFSPSTLCICKLCEQPAASLLHALNCPVFDFEAIDV